MSSYFQAWYSKIINFVHCMNILHDDKTYHPFVGEAISIRNQISSRDSASSSVSGTLEQELELTAIGHYTETNFTNYLIV